MKRGKGNCAAWAGTMWRKGSLATAPLEVVGLLAKLVSYCADNDTDGDVPLSMVTAMVTPSVTRDRARDVTGYVTELVTALCELGKAEVDEDVLRITNYLDYNYSKAEKAQARESARERKRRSRSSPAPVTRDVTRDVTGDVTGYRVVVETTDQETVSDAQIADRYVLSSRAVRVASEGYHEATGVYPAPPAQDVGPRLLEFAQGTDPEDWESPLRVAARNAAREIEGKDVRSWWRIFSRNAHQYVRRVA